MRLLAAFVAHEWRVQSRSLRSRVVAAAMAAGTLGPLVFTAFEPGATGAEAALAVDVFGPALAFLAAAALAVDGITRERDGGAIVVLGLAPISNGGYVLRRWLAIASLVAALSAILAGIGALEAARRGEPFPPAGSFGWPWLLRTLPAVLTGSALGLGFGTIAGGPVLAAVQAVLFGTIALSLGTDLLARTGRVLPGPMELLDLQRVQAFSATLRRHSFVAMEQAGWILPTDAPIDARLQAQSTLADLPVLAMFSAMALAGAVAWTRRSQPDVRPIVISDRHALRSFLGWLNRLRPSAIPDPGLTRTDAAAIGAALGLGALAMGSAIVRFDRIRGMAEARFSAETSGLLEPTEESATITTWTVDGRLDRSGAWRGTFAIGVRNDGASVLSRLACELHPDIELQDVRATSRTVSAARSWDRAELTWAPALAPGEEAVLHGSVAGTAMRHELHDRFGRDPFLKWWGSVRDSELANEIPQLSATRSVRAAGPRWIALQGSDLAPVPRFKTWEPERTGIGEAERLVVPADDIAPAARAVVAIEVDPGVRIADACGAIAEERDGRVVLAGECELPPHEYAVRGGRLAALAGVPPSLAGVLVLPGHAGLARRHVPALAQAAEGAAAAWPGLALPPPPILEQPFSSWIWDGGEQGIEVAGAMVLIAESRLLQAHDLDAGRVTRVTAGRALAARRPLVRSERAFFRFFFNVLVKARLGAGSTAVMQSNQGHPAFRYEHVLLHGRGSRGRLEPAVRALNVLCTEERVVSTVNEWQARPGEGTARELFTLLQERSGRPVLAFYEDFIEGDAVPVLSLAGVGLQGSEPEWRVTGSVRNEGRGRVQCPVVVRTDGEPAAVAVEVSGGETVPFEILVRSRPRLVLLDPGEDCFRYRPLKGIGITERVELDARR